MDATSRSADFGAFLFLVTGVVIVPLLFWPWSDDVFVGPKFDALRLFTAAGAVAAVVWLATRRPAFRLRVTDLAALAFLLLNVIAYALSVDRGTSLLGEPLQQAGLVTIFAMTGAYAVARVSVRAVGRLTVLFIAAATAGTFTSAYGVLQIAGADPVWPNLPLGRAFSSIGQPNWLAAYLVITIPITISLTIATEAGRARWIGLGATLLQVVVLISTLSRSGYAGLLASLVVGGVLVAVCGQRPIENPHRLLVGVVSGTLVCLVVLIGLSSATSSVAPLEVAQRAVSTIDVDSFESRQYGALWEVGFAITADNPFTGTGQDTYAIVFPEYRDDVLDDGFATYFAQFRPESPHNAYLSIAAGTGIPALLAYVVLIGSTGIALVRHIGTRATDSILLSGLVAAMVGHIVTDWFMTIDLSGSWLFWALMGAGLALVDYEAAPATQLTEIPNEGL